MMHIHMHVHMDIRLQCIFTCACTYIYKCIYICIQVYVHMYIYIFLYFCTCTYTHTYTFIHVHVHVRIRTHIQSFMRLLVCLCVACFVYPPPFAVLLLGSSFSGRQSVGKTLRKLYTASISKTLSGFQPAWNILLQESKPLSPKNPLQELQF